MQQTQYLKFKQNTVSGRKPLLIGSSLLMAISMGALALYFYHERRGEAGNIGVLPLIALLVFVTGYSIGFGSVPFVLMGEILPEKRRGKVYQINEHKTSKVL